MDKHIRQLAAIMFTDMVGYTALMQEDEQQAKKSSDQQRKILEKIIPEFHGLILQYYGDGTLSVFGSVIDAVGCAVEIQKELQKEPKIPLRIGMHVGDIVYADDGVYGDAINIASRLESLSVPGGIFVSEKIYDEIKNHPEFPTKFFGKFHLKNVKFPIGVYALTSEGLTVPNSENVILKSGTPFDSIAVLPFVNMSADPDIECFSDGITDEIINALTKVDGLHVTSRTSSFVFKGKTEDVRQIGSKLNVNSILEGSVRKAGNAVRVTAQMINAADGYHLWSEVYDRNLKNIFEVQDEISRNIANKLREKFSGQKIKGPLVKASAKNPEAYNKYLKGLFYWNKFSGNYAKKALKYYLKAIELEPDFALAYAAVAGCYVFLGAIGFIPAKEAYPKAKEFAQKSLELNNNLSESHLSLAMIKFLFDWDWGGAEKCFNKAIELNPGSSAVYHDYSLYLAAIGRFEENVQIAKKALSLDPLSLVNNNSLGNAFFYFGKHDKAIEQLNKTLELEPDLEIALHSLGWIYLDMGDIKKAIRFFKKAAQKSGQDAKRIAPLGYAYTKAGKIEIAQKCLEKIKKKAGIEQNIDLNLELAILYMGLSDFDKVFYYLEKALENRYGEIVFLKLPYWKEIFTDTRYKDIIKKIGL